MGDGGRRHSSRSAPAASCCGRPVGAPPKDDLSANGKGWVPSFTPPFLYGAGGGFSTIFNRPAYQDGVVDEAAQGRAVPDVALDGDPDDGDAGRRDPEISVEVRPAGVHYGEYRIGGTSLSSPLFAGVQAVARRRPAGGRVREPDDLRPQVAVERVELVQGPT